MAEHPNQLPVAPTNAAYGLAGLGVLGVERVAAVANVDDEYSDTKSLRIQYTFGNAVYYINSQPSKAQSTLMVLNWARSARRSRAAAVV